MKAKNENEISVKIGEKKCNERKAHTRKFNKLDAYLFVELFVVRKLNLIYKDITCDMDRMEEKWMSYVGKLKKLNKWVWKR